MHVSISLMILWGLPNLASMISLMKFATIPLVALRSSIASTHLVKYSMATKIQMFPFEGGLTNPIKSSPQVWNGHEVTILCKLLEWV